MTMAPKNWRLGPGPAVSGPAREYRTTFDEKETSPTLALAM
jgi:hypothetical protein